MMSGQVTSAITRNLPPQSGQIDRSIANTLRSRSIQLIGAVGAAGLSWRSVPSTCTRGCAGVRRRRVRFDEFGTTAPRCLALGATHAAVAGGGENIECGEYAGYTAAITP